MCRIHRAKNISASMYINYDHVAIFPRKFICTLKAYIGSFELVKDLGYIITVQTTCIIMLTLYSVNTIFIVLNAA